MPDLDLAHQPINNHWTAEQVDYLNSCLFWFGHYEVTYRFTAERIAENMNWRFCPTRPFTRASVIAKVRRLRLARLKQAKRHP